MMMSSDAGLIHTRNQSRPTRRTDGCGDKRIRKPCSFARKPIHIRRLNQLLAITGKICRHVIDNKPKHIRRRREGGPVQARQHSRLPVWTRHAGRLRRGAVAALVVTVVAAGARGPGLRRGPRLEKKLRPATQLQRGRPASAGPPGRFVTVILLVCAHRERHSPMVRTASLPFTPSAPAPGDFLSSPPQR